MQQSERSGRSTFRKLLPHRHAGLAALLILSVNLALSSSATAAPPLLLKNVRPVDGIHGERVAQDILLREGRIEAMGPALVAPEGATVLEGGGRVVIPGLWDMHVHLTYDERLSDSMPDLFLDYGITSVRDTGGLLEQLKPVVERMRNSEQPMPRVFFSGPLLDGSPVVYDGENAKHIGIENGDVAAALANFARLRDAGVDFIKIYEMVSPDVFAALAQAARDAELPIAAHVPLSMLASEAGPQVGSLEHLRNIEMDCARGADELLSERQQLLEQGREKGREQAGYTLRSTLHNQQRDRAIADEDRNRCARVIRSLRETIQVPTSRLNAMTQYPPFKFSGWQSALGKLPEEVGDSWAEAPNQFGIEEGYRLSGEWTLNMIPRLRDAGVPIGAGTDTPIGWAVPGYSLHNELEVLVAAGLSPQEALLAATHVPASFFALEGEMGQIEIGFVADLVLLNGNPLEHISATSDIQAVIVEGQIARTAIAAESPGR